MRSYVLVERDVMSEMGGVRLYPATDNCYYNDYTETVGGNDLKGGT